MIFVVKIKSIIYNLCNICELSFPKYTTVLLLMGIHAEATHHCGHNSLKAVNVFKNWSITETNLTN